MKQLQSTINDLENNDDYEFGEYSVDMHHLYHHINTAWNARESSSKESFECTQENFIKWRSFPEDIYLGE